MLNYLNLSVLLIPIHPTPKGVGFFGQNRCKAINLLNNRFDNLISVLLESKI